MKPATAAKNCTKVMISFKDKPMILFIGDKRLSSWSLRPWLLLKQFEIPFKEELIFLDQPNSNLEILKNSPSGKVPALLDDGLTVWDSLAIAEYLNEKFPQKGMWPSKREDRALARSISCEIHSGFETMRSHMPHDLQKKLTTFNWEPAKFDLDRIFEIWTTALQRSGGPFLFGEFSIADAMYAPVINRLYSYGVGPPKNVRNYVQMIRDLPAHQEWILEGERR